jgi:phospholipase/carboxylesterase
MNADRPNLGFVHRFVPASDPNRPPLLLLHGTGGNESDLLPLADRVAPGSALLSPRGKVLEDGMPRFFRRLAEGVFDTEDVKRRAQELADFVAAARKTYGIANPIALGFSNGANIAAAMLLLRPETLAGAVLLRPMAPLEPATPPDLKGVPVLMLSGSDDPMSPPASRDRLEGLLRGAGADVRHEIVPAGHGLSAQDLAIVAEWLSTRA